MNWLYKYNCSSCLYNQFIFVVYPIQTLMYYFQFSVPVNSAMEHRLQFTRILLVTMMTICMTQGTLVQKLYKKLEPGEDIAGVVIAEHKRVSSTQCSIR